MGDRVWQLQLIPDCRWQRVDQALPEVLGIDQVLKLGEAFRQARMTFDVHCSQGKEGNLSTPIFIVEDS